MLMTALRGTGHHMNEKKTANDSESAVNSLVMPSDSGQCRWIENESYWETSCNFDWFVNDGTPSDNHMNYCPMCGKIIVEA
jgi:hypothetical protein